MAYRLLTCIGLLALGFLAGCSSAGGTVTLHSLESGRVLEQSFDQAYLSQISKGEYEIILVDSTAQKAARQKPGEPLKPVPLAPLRQVMRIHLFWRPLAMAHGNPAAINASIDWLIFGPDGNEDLLVYKGAGYVTFENYWGRKRIYIRDGQMKPGTVRGEIQDPVGPARIHGIALGKVNGVRVRETIADIQAHLNSDNK